VLFIRSDQDVQPHQIVMWGGVPEVVNHAKFPQNRFISFSSLRGRNLPFFYAWRYGLYNRLATAQPVKI